MRVSPSPIVAAMLLVTVAAHAESVRVTIVDDATGTPVAGALVARMVASPRPQEPTPVGRTDDRGAIALDVDPADRSGFLVTAAGRAPALFGFWGSVPRAHQVRLHASATLAGRVVNADGTPAGGATVGLIDSMPDVVFPFNFRVSPPPLSLLRSTVAGADGRFAFEVDPQAWPADRVRARDAAGHVGEHVGLWTAGARAAAADGTLEVRLDDKTSPLMTDGWPAAPATRPAGPTLSITLRVVDDATGAPIRDVRVTPGGSPSPDQRIHDRRHGTLRFTDEPIRFAFYDDAWAYTLRVAADGYATTPTRLVKGSERSADVELRLKRAAEVAVSVVAPDAKPAAGAKVYLSTPTVTLNVPLTPGADDGSPTATGGPDGVARFAPPGEPYRLAVVHDAGWAEIDASKRLDPLVKLSPWASVAIHIGDGKPLGRDLEIQTQTGYSEDADCWINWSGRGQPDATGTFTQARCKPGRFSPMVMSGATGRIATLPTPDWAYFELDVPEVEAGKATDVRAMTGPARFVARLSELPGMTWDFISLRPVGAACELPKDLATLAPDARERAVEAAVKAAAVRKLHPEAAVRSAYLKPTAAGEIGTTGLMPGTYSLSANATPIGDPRGEGKQAQRYFVVPDEPNAVVDLGTLSPDAPAQGAFNVGDVAPALTSTTLDGQPFDLAALRGKWVLLDFWGTWCGFCIAEEPTYRDAFEGWGADGRLTMVSLAVDDTPEKVREHLKTHDLPWTHVVLGEREKTDVPQRFGVEGYPTVMLISPEGKLVTSSLRGGSLREALIKHLGPAAPPRATTQPARQ